MVPKLLLCWTTVLLTCVSMMQAESVPSIEELLEDVMAMVDSASEDVSTASLNSRVEPAPGEVVDGTPYPTRHRYLPVYKHDISHLLADWEGANSHAPNTTQHPPTTPCASQSFTSPWPGASVALVLADDTCDPRRDDGDVESTFAPNDDHVVATGFSQRIDVLRNDRHSNTWVGGVCTERPVGPNLDARMIPEVDTSKDEGKAFVDVFPLRDWIQKEERTAPNCIFPYYDRNSRRWDDQSLCILELLTGGVAVGDYDGDGRIDVFFTAMDRPSLLLRNMGCRDGSESCAEVVFADRTAEAGFPVGREHHRVNESDGYIRMNAARFVDTDGDGDLDLLTGTMGEQRFYFWENDGTGHFTERAVESGLNIDRRRPEEYVPFHGIPRPWTEVDGTPMTSSFTIAAADTDGDSLPEFYTTEWFTRLEMTDLGAFEDLEEHPNPTRGFPNELTTARLLQNNGISARARSASGNKAFRDRTSQAGIFGRSHKSTVSWSDPKATIAQYNVMLQESAVMKKSDRIRFLERWAHMVAFTWRDELLGAIQQYERGAEEEHEKSKDEFEKHRNHFLGFGFSGLIEFGSTFQDLDLDGHQDLVISGDFGTTQLYINRGSHGEVGGGKSGAIISGRGATFRPMFFSIPTDSTDSTMGCSVGDFDNDGLPDVYFTSISVKEISESPLIMSLMSTFDSGGFDSGFQGNHLYRGSGRRDFADVSRLSGVIDAGWAWGATFWDYDNDGDLDLIVVNGLDDPETTDDDFAVNQATRMFENTLVGATSEGKNALSSRSKKRRSRRQEQPTTFNEPATKAAGPKETLFVDKAESLNLVNRKDGRSVVVADFGGDGKLDVVTANHASQPQILVNHHGASDEYGWLRVHVVQPTIGDMVRSGIVAAAVNAHKKTKRGGKSFPEFIASFSERVLGCLAGDAMERVSALIDEARDPNGVWASVEPTLESAVPAALSSRSRSASGARVWVRTKYEFEDGGHDSEIHFPTSSQQKPSTPSRLPRLPLDRWMERNGVRDEDGLSAINAPQTGSRVNETARLPPAFGGDGVQYREVASQSAFMGQSDETPHFGLGPGIKKVASVTVQWPWLRASRTLWNVPVGQTLRVSPPLSSVVRFGAALLSGTCPEVLPPALRRGFVPLVAETPREREVPFSPIAIEPLHTNWVLQHDNVHSCDDPRIEKIVTPPQHGTATVVDGLYIHYEPNVPGEAKEDSLQYSVGGSIATLHIRTLEA